MAERTATRRRSTEKGTKQLLAESLPPQNLDAERAVLGSIMRDNFCMTELVKYLAVEHFYSAKHQKIYTTMKGMFDDAKPVDPYTLGEELTRRGWLMEVGGAPSLIDLYEETFTAANVQFYARIVYDKGLTRSLIHTATEILRDAYESTSSADDLLSEAERKVYALVEQKGSGQIVEIAEALHRAFDRISERQSGEGRGITGIPSGFFDLDELTNGWQDSEMIILAARPSMGKTALALNLIEHAAVEGRSPSLFVSLEMSELELTERLLCSRSRVNSHLLRHGRIGSDEMLRLTEASEALAISPIFIDATPGLNMTQITATARRLKHRNGLRFILVDYLQFVEADDRSVPRQEQIATISRRLKNLAREIKCPVIALSQLNRAAETRRLEGHRPRMSDLRESGSIEQDADIIMLLHRDEQYDPQQNPGQADLIVAKHRNGPVGDIKLTFRKEFTRFENFHAEMTPFSAAGDF